ncbi:hypothetical protein FRC01_013163 [Tulasnella sp. 417]|nr:hypothetical protein FRC01_013163 [Tulasnella sp. 417]
MPAPASTQALGKMDSSEPRASIATHNLESVRRDPKGTQSSGFNPFTQGTSVVPEDKENNEGGTAATLARDAGISPRSMLFRARACSARNCLTLEKFLTLPEVKPTPPVTKDVRVVNEPASVRAPGPPGLRSAFSSAQAAKTENSKVIPPPVTVYKSRPSSAWLLPSTILKNSIRLIGCNDSQVDEFDDLAAFVGAYRRNVFDDAWVNVIAAVTTTAEKQDLDNHVETGRGEGDVTSVVGCGSMDDPVVETGPRANGGMKGAYWSKLTSGGGLAGAHPFNPSPSSDFASPRWEALTIEPL